LARPEEAPDGRRERASVLDGWEARITAVLERFDDPRVGGQAIDRIDAPEGRTQYARRFATVEPVFANLRASKRLDRFTLHGCVKVDTQWKLYCMVHNIEKLANFGYAA
jgi:hypothetical protein